MIDTLHLTLNDYEIRPRAKLRVQPAPLDVETGEQLPACALWSTRGGGAVEGVKAYHNGEAMNVSIVPCGRVGADESAPMLRLVGSAPSVNCYVNFSLPKRCAGNNYAPVGLEKSREAVRGVERELREIGIKTNIERATLSRLDVFRNVITDEPFIAYQRVFNLLQAKRMQKREYGGTGFLWENTQQQCCVYDKLAEMMQRKMDVLGYPANTVRFEHRLLNGRKVRDALGGVRTVAELWEGYERVAACFEKAMRSHLFRFTTEEIEIQTGNELEKQMRLFKERGGREWFNAFLRAKGLEALVCQAETETILKAAAKVASVGASESQARVVRHRLARKIHQAQLDLEFIKPLNEGTPKTIGTLYRELESKVLYPERLAA